MASEAELSAAKAAAAMKARRQSSMSLHMQLFQDVFKTEVGAAGRLSPSAAFSSGPGGSPTGTTAAGATGLLSGLPGESPSTSPVTRKAKKRGQVRPNLAAVWLPHSLTHGGTSWPSPRTDPSPHHDRITQAMASRTATKVVEEAIEYPMDVDYGVYEGCSSRCASGCHLPSTSVTLRGGMNAACRRALT